MKTDRIEQTAESDRGDDLTAISGIGPGYAKALKRINIQRYSDILGYVTNEELHKALADAGVDVPLWKIIKYDWVGKAQELADMEEDEEAPSLLEEWPAESVKSSYASPAGWVQYAGFNVYFEHSLEEDRSRDWHTVVYKSLEPDGFNDKQVFEGIEPGVWVDWIMNRAELPPDANPVSLASEQPSEFLTHLPASEKQLVVRDMSVSMLPPSSEYPEKRLNASVRFSLIGPDAEALANRYAPFRVEVHAVDVETRTPMLVASGQSQFQPEVLEYTSNQAFPLPDVGRYDIFGLVLLLPPAEMMACHQGPTIRIRP